MATDNEEMMFNNALCGRVKRWREELNVTAAEMAASLGIPADRYRKYETRSPLPVYLMPKFCFLCNATLDNLILGTPRSKVAPTLTLSRLRSRA